MCFWPTLVARGSPPNRLASSGGRPSVALPLTWLDVFTAEPLTGNPLAVVHDADELSDETMQRFARRWPRARFT